MDIRWFAVLVIEAGFIPERHHQSAKSLAAFFLQKDSGIYAGRGTLPPDHPEGGYHCREGSASFEIIRDLVEKLP
jgi:hypothetical protein